MTNLERRVYRRAFVWLQLKRNRKSELSGGVVVRRSELLVRRSAARAKTDGRAHHVRGKLMALHVHGETVCVWVMRGVRRYTRKFGETLERRL